MRIAIIGDGGWGTANAVLLAGYGHEVALWGAFPDYISEMTRTRMNERFLSGVALPESIHLTADCMEAVEGADVVALAAPSKYYAAVVSRFKGLIDGSQLVVSLTKGLCETTNKRMSELAKEILGIDSVVALAGPTHAEEVARGAPTAIVAACEDVEMAKSVQRIWSGPRFRVYTSSDPVGVEIGGAVKNVIAIAVGCSDGMGFGDNTQAALITRGLVEMNRFVLAYGGKAETLSGLAGVGDMIVTCTSIHSRNHLVGLRLGRGEKMVDILASMQMVAEGVWNSEVIYRLAKKLNVDMPICKAVYEICHKGLGVDEAVKCLMGRSLTEE